MSHIVFNCRGKKISVSQSLIIKAKRFDAYLHFKTAQTNDKEDIMQEIFLDDDPKKFNVLINVLLCNGIDILVNDCMINYLKMCLLPENIIKNLTSQKAHNENLKKKKLLSKYCQKANDRFDCLYIQIKACIENYLLVNDMNKYESLIIKGHHEPKAYKNIDHYLFLDRGEFIKFLLETIYDADHKKVYDQFEFNYFKYFAHDLLIDLGRVLISVFPEFSIDIKQYNICINYDLVN